MLRIAPESPRSGAATALLDRAEAHANALYPPESNHIISAGALVDAGAVFLVAWLDGAAVGCGALVPGPDGGLDGAGELKRMFVLPGARGRGVGRALIAALEAAARQAGRTVLRLVTGTASHAALALYRACGYAERGPFAPYRPDPLSVFMEKSLI